MSHVCGDMNIMYQDECRSTKVVRYRTRRMNTEVTSNIGVWKNWECWACWGEVLSWPYLKKKKKIRKGQKEQIYQSFLASLINANENSIARPVILYRSDCWTRKKTD